MRSCASRRANLRFTRSERPTRDHRTQRILTVAATTKTMSLPRVRVARAREEKADSTKSTNSTPPSENPVEPPVPEDSEATRTGGSTIFPGNLNAKQRETEENGL